MTLDSQWLLFSAGARPASMNFLGLSLKPAHFPSSPTNISAQSQRTSHHSTTHTKKTSITQAALHLLTERSTGYTGAITEPYSVFSHCLLGSSLWRSPACPGRALFSKDPGHHPTNSALKHSQAVFPGHSYSSGFQNGPPRTREILIEISVRNRDLREHSTTKEPPVIV